jgi:hypothetical protein
MVATINRQEVLLGWDISNSHAVSHELYSCLAAAAVVAFVLLGVPTVRGRVL